MDKIPQIFPDEYIVSERNKCACPSARYVGGTSRYLCECKAPRECEGVKLTAADTVLRAAAWDALEELTSWNETHPEDEGTAEAVQRLRAALGCDE